MRPFTQRIISLAIAAFAAAILSFAAPKAAEAAPLSTGVATSITGGQIDLAEKAQYYGYRRRYGYGGGYGRRYGYGGGYGRRYGYRRPAFYGRRCVVRPRVVATPYGYRRRLVRVCY